ncbi:glycosyltransferase family 39 protein [Thermoanaerobacterium sp. R66]|uniref:glycosyltransferase family 39 protein n=1 Tax=Thermoanaerobacterium sp. R66 TaxID=2742479 RepID=UPI0023805885|nr:glycosyltransferase family 39 protein [Thermoanaerobacterium sp. R66]MDE4542844.1 glycosyltransferase family 39 protein [Thermoanaerobacterium sp. R66]
MGKKVVKYSLAFILVLSVILSVYSLYHYSGSTEGFRGNFQHSFIQGSTNRSWGSGNTNQGVWQRGNPSQVNGQNGQSQWQMPRSRGDFGGFRGTSSKYGVYIMAYAAIVFLLFILSYYALKNKKFKLDLQSDVFIIASLFLIGFFMRLYIAATIEGYSGDIGLFRSWAQSASQDILNFYKNTPSCDYPPLYIYVLYLVGKIASIGNLSHYYNVLLKLPSILADIASSYIIYKIANKHFAKNISAFMSSLYIFNPAVFINSSAWGQVDSFFTMLVIMAVYFLSEKNLWLSSVFFTAAVLMKPQGIIFAPVLFFEVVNERSLKNFLKVLVASLITAVIVLVPFAIGQDPLWIFKLYEKTISEYPYASVNGFNFYGLLGANYVNSGTRLFVFSYSTWGFIFIVLTTLFSWFIYIKGKNSNFAYLAALLQIALVFTFSTGMHERYLFPAVALAILTFLYVKDMRLFGLFAGFSVTSFLNMYYVLFGGLRNSFGFIPMMVSLANVIMAIYLVKVSYDVAIINKVCTFDLDSQSHEIHTTI